MIALAFEAFLRALSVFGPILLLKEALNGLTTSLDTPTQFVYILIILTGAPAIFILANLTATALKSRGINRR